MSSTDQDQPAPWSACLQLTKAGAGVAAAVSAGLCPAAADTCPLCCHQQPVLHNWSRILSAFDTNTPTVTLQQTLALATLCDMYHVQM